MRHPLFAKSSYLTTLPADDDRNAFLQSAACQNCPDNLLAKALAGDGLEEPLTGSVSTTPRLQAAPNDGEHTDR